MNSPSIFSSPFLTTYASPPFLSRILKTAGSVQVTGVIGSSVPLQKLFVITTLFVSFSNVTSCSSASASTSSFTSKSKGSAFLYPIGAFVSTK